MTKKLDKSIPRSVETWEKQYHDGEYTFDRMCLRMDWVERKSSNVSEEVYTLKKTIQDLIKQIDTLTSDVSVSFVKILNKIGPLQEEY